MKARAGQAGDNAPASAITPFKGGFRLRIRLTPKAAADAIDGPGADAVGAMHLKARVRAVPEKGAANAALEALLAKTLSVPKSAVRVEKGASGRLKIVAIKGDAAALTRAREILGEVT
jgi:uncharacterized protein YggU (UPF0235/DUF167 family)